MYIQYNVLLWRVHVTILAVETQHALCVCVLFEPHITVSYIKILSLVQQRYYGAGNNKTYVRL